MVDNQNNPPASNNQASQTAQKNSGSPPVDAAQAKVAQTILIVEDDPVLSRMYTEKLKHEGFKVLVANNGETGLKMALEERVSLILLDIMLPKLSGTDLLERLRADPRGKTLPVVALSNLAEQTEKDKVLKFGAKEYLIKAMQTPEQVVEKIKKYLV